MTSPSIRETEMKGKPYGIIMACLGIAALLVLALAASTEGLKDSRTPQVEYEKDTICWGWHTPFLPLKVEYEDSVHHVLLRENELHLFPRLKEMKYRDRIFEAIRTPIRIDSTQWSAVKSLWNPFITPQPRIDSLYGGDARNLLPLLELRADGTYGFDDEEGNYLIYLLFQHRIYLNTDCETGCYYVVEDHSDKSTKQKTID